MNTKLLERVIVIAAASLMSAYDFSNAQDRNLTQERQCGNQAARVIEKEWPRLKEELGAAWESHYNSKLNRCLILLTFMTGTTKEIPDNYQHGLVVDADTRQSSLNIREDTP